METERAVRAGRGFNLFISNEDINDVIKIIKSLENSGGGVTETVKYEIEAQEGGFLRALLAALTVLSMQPVISSVVKSISERGIRRAGRRYVDKTF